MSYLNEIERIAAEHASLKSQLETVTRERDEAREDARATTRIMGDKIDQLKSDLAKAQERIRLAEERGNDILRRHLSEDESTYLTRAEKAEAELARHKEYECLRAYLDMETRAKKAEKRITELEAKE